MRCVAGMRMRILPSTRYYLGTLAEWGGSMKRYIYGCLIVSNQKRFFKVTLSTVYSTLITFQYCNDSTF